MRYRSRRLLWLATIRTPAAARSPPASSWANSRTRSFSLTTCWARARITGSAIDSVSCSVALRSGPISASANVAFGDALCIGTADENAVGDELHDDLDIVGDRHGFDRHVTAIDQQGVVGYWPAAMTSWSMIPHGTPDALISARRQSWARLSASPSKPSANATANFQSGAARQAGADRDVGDDRSVDAAVWLHLGDDTGDVLGPRRLDVLRIIDLQVRARPAAVRLLSAARWCRLGLPRISVQRSIVIGITMPPV